MTGCLGHNDPPFVHPDPDPGQDQPPGGGSQSPPKIVRGPHKMSDVHVEPGGERVWIVHHGVGDLNAKPNVETAHFGVYVPDTGEFADVLDTTGTLGKRIVFPATGRVLYVTQRGTAQDVFVSLDTVARRPLAQSTYPGDRQNFRLSPNGRALISTNKTDRRLHVLDTTSLVDRAMPADIIDADGVAWAPGQDMLYALRLRPAATQLVRYDLRTADLGNPLPAPAIVAADLCFDGPIVVSPDGRHLGVGCIAADDTRQVSLIDATTGAVTTVAGDSVSDFTRDGRAIVWHTNAPEPDSFPTTDFRLVDPATGTAAATVVTGLVFPTGRPLRDHDIILVDGYDESADMTNSPFQYHTTDGSRTPSAPSAAFATSLFERPGHDELWLWVEYRSVLARYDLATGEMTTITYGDDSVDYRTASDDIIIGSFVPSLRRLSMATAKGVGMERILGYPSDVTAPFKLDDQ